MKLLLFSLFSVFTCVAFVFTVPLEFIGVVFTEFIKDQPLLTIFTIAATGAFFMPKIKQFLQSIAQRRIDRYVQEI